MFGVKKLFGTYKCCHFSPGIRHGIRPISGELRMFNGMPNKFFQIIYFYFILNEMKWKGKKKRKEFQGKEEVRRA